MTATMNTIEIVEKFDAPEFDAPVHAANFLKSLGHPDRLRLLCVILDGEKTVGEIEHHVGASQSSISQHLAKLRSQDIVTCRRDGRRILYSISDETVLGIISLLYDKFCAEGTMAAGK